MVDANLLKAAYKSRGLRQEDIANALGISPSAFYRKLIGKNEFKMREVDVLIKLLDLKRIQVFQIFFANACT